MKIISRAFVLLIATTTLSACSAAKVAVKPEAISKVENIALVQVNEPQTYVANDFGNIGAAFGAIGGVAVAMSSKDATVSVDQAAKKEGFSAGQYLSELLQKELTALGYKIKTIQVPREKTHELLENYENINTDGAEALLDVAINSIGYATEHPLLSSHWRPASVIEVNLVNGLTTEKIYSEKFMYGYHNPFMSGTDLDAPEAYHFKNKEEMYSDDKVLVEGMQDSIKAVVQRVASSLKK
jgi:hypothetical protein